MFKQKNIEIKFNFILFSVIIFHMKKSTPTITYIPIFLQLIL